MAILETNTTRVKVYNSSLPLYQQVTPDVSWTTYTPALTASTTNPTLGPGSATFGRYRFLAEKYIRVQVRILFGTSGTNAGSGFYRISTPLTADGGNIELSNNIPIGSAWLFNTAIQKSGVVRLITSTTIEIEEASSGNAVSNSVPYVWSVNNQITAQFDFTTV